MSEEVKTVNPLEDHNIQQAIAACSKHQRFLISIWTVSPGDDNGGKPVLTFTRMVHDFPVPDMPEVQNQLKAYCDEEIQKAVANQVANAPPIPTAPQMSTAPSPLSPVMR